MIRPVLIALLLLSPLCLAAQTEAYIDSVREVISKYSDSIEVAVRQEDYATQIHLLRKRSALHERAGSFELSIADMHKRVNIAKISGDDKSLAHSYYKLGVLYQRQDEDKQAIHFCKKGIAISKALGDSAQVASFHHRLGICYNALGQDSVAITHLRKSLAIRRKGTDKIRIAASLNAISLVYMSGREFDKAFPYMKESYDLWSQTDDAEGKAIVGGNLAKYYQQIKMYPQAMYYGLEAYNNAKTVNSLLFLKDCSKTLSEVMAELGKHDEALFYYQEYSNARDSLFNTQNRRIITELREQFNAAESEQQIALLEQKGQFDKIKMERQRVFTIVLLSGLFLVLLLGLVAFRAYRQARRLTADLQDKNETIRAKNRDITSSIKYAKRIQEAMLTDINTMNANLGEHFVLYEPRDIVSGDFYWLHAPTPDLVVLAVADCTGHGVPGAFMSMIGASMLNEIVIENKEYQPEKILDRLNIQLIKALKQSGEAQNHDGMDVSLISWNKTDKTITYAGANNPIYVVDGETLEVYRPDKQPIGYYRGRHKPFHAQTIEAKTGAVVYLFTDGFMDQFGGEDGKKLKSSNFKKLLRSVAHEDATTQKEKLSTFFEKWKGTNKQLDDVCVVGIRF